MEGQAIVEIKERLDRAAYRKFIRFILLRRPWGLLMLGFFRPVFPRIDWSVPFESVVRFYEDKFTSTSMRKGHVHCRTLSYDLIARVYERDSAFYVQYKCGRYDCFPKAFFSGEQAVALRGLFAHRFGEKFRGM